MCHIVLSPPPAKGAYACGLLLRGADRVGVKRPWRTEEELLNTRSALDWLNCADAPSRNITRTANRREACQVARAPTATEPSPETAETSPPGRQAGSSGLPSQQH